MIHRKVYNSETATYEMQEPEYVGRSIYAHVGSSSLFDMYYSTLEVVSIDTDGVVHHSVLSHDGGDRPLSTTDCVFAIDYTDEVFNDYFRAQYAEYLVNYTNELQKEYNNPAVIGRVVKVVSGRKSKGVTGKVVAMVNAEYGMGYRSILKKKLAVATSDRTETRYCRNGSAYERHMDVVWVWVHNCEVANPKEITEEDNLTLVRRATISASDATAGLMNDRIIMASRFPKLNNRSSY